jgi:hypothetical protein
VLGVVGNGTGLAVIGLEFTDQKTRRQRQFGAPMFCINNTDYQLVRRGRSHANSGLSIACVQSLPAILHENICQ